MKHLIRAVSVLLLVLLTGVGAQATPLSDLFNGGSITAGDKLFDNWQLRYYDTSDPTRNFNAANIDVTPLTDGGTNPGPGLQFTVSNSELSVTGDGIYAYVDLMFGFRATVLDPTMRIVGNSLELTDGSVTMTGDNGFYIHEDIGTTAGGSNLGTKSVEFSWLDSSLIESLSDSATFAQQSGVWVTKNIVVWATSTAETADLAGFEQRFAQEAGGNPNEVVPEPATFALMALGLVGVVVARRTKKQ
ncbi:PEP-CTERM sorting domain-containing protein [Geobacter hydrogenophilus]|uniref:Ice-binding protein C-terminal domain-containing protein n=1 Tax=Geobacter hydrogenophilus TaxID=40983 RepID=A0A9W6G3W4_9BACT|nr:PEP-CTERM sorting domain-containing protein [Geobacter hydrogenophilus]MBT0892574.1 PEP-CTERM sorting domain-containing protein [Geobacter hydrogenophilus]GLI39971.1 hypothetical protein GHYDROH2_34720 [Geobacter hydrogenophilus]